MGLMVLEAAGSATASRPLSESDPDGDLVAAVRRGDERAFEVLYARYQRRISAYVFGMVKDHGRAEDITQEVFISALRRMRETERPIVFKPWIYEIAKNACIDQFRRSRRTEEVSIDGVEGLGSADQGRLVASQPTPDMAVNAKQQLDHLCGAFGGLSDAHHEILVLRELEGLSYREIGDHMGLSRPGVESTLFRARRRLTEEYHELVSGQRCQRIQGIIAEAAAAMPGARDSKRLSRHIAHCQPCRRQAALAGLDTTALPRPVRRRIAEKVAGLLPFPAFLRPRWLGGGRAQMAGPVSEPTAAAWSKAVAAAATLVIAGGGIGAATHGPGPAPVSAHKPAAQTRTATGASGTQRVPAVKRAVASERLSGVQTPRRQASRRKAASDRGAGPTTSGGGTPASSPGAPAAGADRASSQTLEAALGRQPSLNGGSTVELPGVQVPLPDLGGTPPAVDETVKAVGDTGGAVVEQAGQVVSDTTQSLPLPPLGG